MSFKIGLGPAGNCISAREPGWQASFKRLKELNLTAEEIEFVRGVKMKNDTAEQLGEEAKKYDIELSIHAPYYINLASKEKSKIKASEKRILDSLERGHYMGARVVVVHAGYYGNDKEEANKKIIEGCRKLVSKIKENGWKILLGLETTGKQTQWGTLEEIIELCRKVRCIPVLDPAHIYARNGGHINYKEVFEKLEILKLKHYHCHFSGIKYRICISGGNEWYHLPLKMAGPDFEDFAKEILKRKLDITIISESPILEKDSLYMKNIFEKLGHKF